MKLKLFLIGLISLICVIRGEVLAEESSMCSSNQDCAIKIEEAGKLREKANKEIQNLSSRISSLDSQIRYYNLKVSESRLKITEMEGNIASLSSKIERLNEALDSLENLLGKRVETAYKDNRWKIWEVLAGKQGLTEKIRSLAYLRSAQMHDRQLLLQMRDTKANYNEQKSTLENLKKNLELEKRRLENYQVAAAEEIKQKQILLELTQGEEEKYKKLQEQLQEQKSKLLGGVLALTGGQAGTLREWSGDNHYFNQADSRWANNIINKYFDYKGNPSYMWKYGCAVTSAAIILNKLGLDVNPVKLLQSNIYSEDLIAWQKIQNYYQIRLVNNAYQYKPGWGLIDNYLNGSKWVIVGLDTNPYGENTGHYVVLQKKDGDDYIIHDPWYGPDIKFSKYYTKGMVVQVIVYERN